MTSSPETPATAATDLEGEAAVDEAAHFYDRTVTAAWRLAVHLYDHDVRGASDAVVEAYRRVWAQSPERRDQASLLHALVTGARGTAAPVPA